jgi:DNA polymerase III delta prime subunit
MENAVAQFRSSVVAEYELDTEIVDQLCNLFRKNAEGLTCATAKPKKAKAEKTTTDTASVATTTKSVKSTGKAAKAEKAEKTEKAEKADKVPRKKSAYNLFVKEKMQDADIKSLSHKDKMSKIAEKWQTCDKEKYAKMAAELGEVDTVTIVTSA